MLHNQYQMLGGEDTVALMEQALLERKGHTVVHYRRHNDEITDYNLLQKISLLWRTTWSSRSYADVCQIIKEERPDVAHVHNFFPLISPAGLSACHDMGVPLVYTLHNYRFLCANAILYRAGHVCEECIQTGPWRAFRYGCYRNSRLHTIPVSLMNAFHQRRGTWVEAVAVYIALTEFSKKLFVRAGIPEERIVIKPHFIDPDPGVGDDGGYALYVGRLFENKGIKTLVSAWRKLNGIPLKVIGEGYLRKELQETALHEGLDVEFLGIRPLSDVLHYLKGARFLVVPSLHHEGFPRVLVEALSFGVPVIATNVDPLPELVAHGRTGLIFEAGSSESLSAQVEWALTHEDTWRLMRKSARSEFETRYSAESNYCRLMEIYHMARATKDSIT